MAQRELLKFSKQSGIPTDVPFRALNREQQKTIVQGRNGFDGVMGFFDFLETKSTSCTCGCFFEVRGYTLCRRAAARVCGSKRGWFASRAKDASRNLRDDFRASGCVFDTIKLDEALDEYRRPPAARDSQQAEVFDRRRAAIPDA